MMMLNSRYQTLSRSPRGWKCKSSSDTVFVLTADEMVTPVTFAGVKGTPFTPEKRESGNVWRGLDLTESGNVGILFNTSTASNANYGWRGFDTDGTQITETYPFTAFGFNERGNLRGFCREVEDRTKYLVGNR